MSNICSSDKVCLDKETVRSLGSTVELSFKNIHEKRDFFIVKKLLDICYLNSRTMCWLNRSPMVFHIPII